jgi:hypothetical protein
MNQQQAARQGMGRRLGPVQQAMMAGGVPIGMDPCEGLNRNACAAQLQFNVQFADGDAIVMSPPPVGSEDGNLEEILAGIQTIADHVKEAVTLRFKQRKG